MHELSIAENLLELVKLYAKENNISKVTKIIIETGEITSIVPENLNFYFSELKKNTLASQADLIVRVIPLQGFCSVCQIEVHINNYNFLCGTCGNELKITQGEELRLYQIEGER